MKIQELVYKNRSYRRFYQDCTIDRALLEELVDLGRVSASGSNLQPLKYMLSYEVETNRQIFPYLAWAGYLKEWSGPEEGERPSAYIIILGDTSIAKKFGYDHGIAAQSILLGAAEKGLGGCMIGAIRRAELSSTLNIPAQYEVLLVLALGVAKETVRLTSIPEGGSIEYYRTSDGVHYVPKRTLTEIVLN
jgi:nitroreductase